jgi:8-oxo-dGTP pyrophosphatase MutT (NUDIX family)
MEKYKIIETTEKNGKKITYIWHPGIIPEGVVPQQVFGFTVTPEKLVVLVRDGGEDRFTPPGGGIESGETPLQALIREFSEEAQFEPKNIKLLGSLEVIYEGAAEEIQRHNLQVRFVGTAENLTPFVPNKDGFEVEERILVPYADLPKYVGFSEKYASGRVQYEMFCDYIEGRLVL